MFFQFPSFLQFTTVVTGIIKRFIEVFENKLYLKEWKLNNVINQYLKSLYLELKALGQCGCEQWKGFSPVWLKAWSRSFSSEVNRAPHTKHSFPLPLPTSSSPSSLSLSFTLSLSLSVRGSGAALPNSLAAVRRPCSSGVSAVIRCEASAAAAAMAALECRCHENSLIAPLPPRLNLGSCRLGVVEKEDNTDVITERADEPEETWRKAQNLEWDRTQMLWHQLLWILWQHCRFVLLSFYLFKTLLSFCRTLLLQSDASSSSPSPNSYGWWWVGNTVLHLYHPVEERAKKPK